MNFTDPLDYGKPKRNIRVSSLFLLTIFQDHLHDVTCIILVWYSFSNSSKLAQEKYSAWKCVFFESTSHFKS